jgi:hypothetical protein
MELIMANDPNARIEDADDGFYEHAGADVWIKRDGDGVGQEIVFAEELVDRLDLDPEDVIGTAEHEGRRRDDAAKNS